MSVVRLDVKPAATLLQYARGQIGGSFYGTGDAHRALSSSSSPVLKLIKMNFPTSERR